MSNAQHRCVFVGNIPYDATEKELIRICEEVGPVVSFRLVVDRDTGKPKGYGFCEYRDEETALSARRNLQGYEINGRQLRVDFAENEKGSADRNREQGRGGPGLVDISKQNVGAKVSRDPSLNQPVGLPAAASAAAVMAGVLGAPQMPMGATAAPGAGRPPMGIDALTVHLANMSRYQLYDILNQMKNFIQQNQQQARQILISNPQLVKALFQAQVMLGLIQQPLQVPQTQNMLQPPLLTVPQVPNVGQMQSQPQGAPQSQPQRPPQNMNFQVPSHPQQQMNPRPGPPLLPPQSMQAPPPPQSSMGLPPQAITMQRTQPQPPMHMNPPLPQQVRPMLPSSPPQAAQGAGFQFGIGQQSQHPQLQQPGGLPPPSSLPFQGMQPPLPNQPPPQHLQASRPIDGAGSAGIMQGGIKVPTSLPESTQLPSTSAPFGNWNQLPPNGSLMCPPAAPPTAVPVSSMPMGSNYPSIGPTNNNPGAIRSAPNEGSAAAYPKEGSQQPSVQPPGQQQSQVPMDPQQHMALLQQVMNLTPEQINSLPAETRQQVLDLQQVFRSQGIQG